MSIRSYLFFFLLVISLNAQGTYLLSGSPIEIGFDDFMGKGLSPLGSDGTLDSSHWKVAGLSQGDTTYGGTHLAGDFGRGVSGGGVRMGGVYAFDTGNGNHALGGQATGSDLSPGQIMLRLVNDTGGAIEGLQVEYDLFLLNNGNRSTLFELGYAVDGRDIEYIADLSFVSEGNQGRDPNWSKSFFSILIEDLFLGASESMELIWSVSDYSGGGSRDEFALDNIRIGMNTSIPEPSGVWLVGLGGMLLLGYRCLGPANQAVPGRSM